MPQRHSRPVGYPLLRSRQLGWWLQGMLVVSGCALLAWGCWGAGHGAALWLRLGLAACLWLVCACCSRYVLRHQPEGTLHWSGTAWAWIGAETQVLPLQGEPLVVLDMQWLLVLTFVDAEQRAQRFVLQRDWAPQIWADLRRAVYSSAHSPQDAGR